MSNSKNKFRSDSMAIDENIQIAIEHDITKLPRNVQGDTILKTLKTYVRYIEDPYFENISEVAEDFL